MPAINVMIKPASGLCNMRCKYCFYADETARRAVPSYGIMSYETLEAVLKRVLNFATGSCNIMFQGGEPTMAGLDFFKTVMQLEEKWNVNHVAIYNAIQTNGYNLNREWAAFYAEHHFLVGLSLDGPKDVHDLYRVDADGEGTFQRVTHAMQLLRQYQVEFNVLTVVTNDAARNIRKIYGFFQRNQLAWQQYIPCLDPLDEVRGQHIYSLLPEDFESYLKNLFDCWYNEAMRGYVRYNRYFINLINMMRGQAPEACGMSGVCGRQFVVEADGSVYPCDFYMLDEWRLGSFITDSFEQIEAKRNELGFVELSKQVDDACKTCKWAALCRGGCRRDREPMQNGLLQKNYFCNAYYNFFEYAYPRLLQLSQTLHN